MRFDLGVRARVLTFCLLIAVVVVPSCLFGQSHVVSPADFQKEMVAATQQRQHNLDVLKQFLTSPVAEKALKSAQMDSAKINTAVSTLSDQELADLSARANKAQSDFAAG